MHGQGLSLTDAGAVLSIGTFIGIAVSPVAGALMDRIGPIPVLLVSNLIRLAGFGFYPLAFSAWHVVMVTAVISIGDRLFWTSNAPFAATITTGRDTENLLGTQNIARFLRAGLGAGMTALLPAMTLASAFHLLAYANAASFGIAAALIGLLRAPRLRQTSPPPARRPHIATGSWRVVLRDRGYVGLCAAHLLFTFASVGKYSMLPVLVIDVLHGPLWVAGTAIALGTVVFVAAQQPVIRLARRHSRGAGLMTAAALFASSFALLGFTSCAPISIATVVILLTSAVSAIAEALFAPIGTAAAAVAAPVTAQGRSSALFQLSWSAAIAIGPILLTNLLAIGSAILWLTLAAMSLAAVPAVLRLRRALPAHVLATAPA